MRALVWSKSFSRALGRTVKMHPNLKDEIRDALDILVENPFDSRLATHKLKGKLAGTWACSAGYNCRIILLLLKAN